MKEIEKLKNLDYKTESHTFSKGVIASYYNGLEYPMEVTDKYIRVKRRKENVFFFLEKIKDIDFDIKDIIYTQEKTEMTSVKTKEVIYDLEKLFTSPDKNIRRGITLTKRPEVEIREVKDIERAYVKILYDEWVEKKNNDPKVYKIAFTPKRYLRSFDLKEKGFNVVEFIVLVRSIPYAVLCFEKQSDVAFELSFLSRFWRKNLKIINDLNECVLINCFFKLWLQGIKKVNVGPTAGIKGLKTFKSKMPFDELIIYSN